MDAANPVIPQKRLAFVRPVLQKTLAKWMLQSWTYSRRKNLSDVEKYQADRRCLLQIPSLGGRELRTKSKEGLCRKVVKNRSNTAGCIPCPKMSVSQASICKLSESYCGKDVTACRASCSAISARHLTVGAVSCSTPLRTLPVSEAMDTGNCLNIDNSSVSGCDRDGTICALKSCKHMEGEKTVYSEGSEIPESRNFPNCVKLCASACEEGHLNRKTRVLNSQPCQALKITTLQTEGKKTGSQPQTFCDAFSQFLMCSSRTMDAVKRKIEKVPDEAAQCMAKVPLDCKRFSDLRANISAKKQLDFSKEVLPEHRTKISVKEAPDFSVEVPPELNTQISVKLQLGLSDETFSDPMAKLLNKAALNYTDEKLPDVVSESHYNRVKGTFETDSERSEKLDMSNQSETDSVTIASISRVDNSICDGNNLVSDDVNCTIHNGCKFPETVDISAMADKSPTFLEHTGFAGNLAQFVTTHGKSISTQDNRVDKITRISPSDLKDNGAEETISICDVKRGTLLTSFTDVGLNSEHEQQNIVRSKVTVSENLDSGISDSEQASSRHTTDSSQGSMGVMDTADVAIKPIRYVAMETTEDVAMETLNWHESESSGAVPVHYSHSSVKHGDASAKELNEEITVEDSSDSDACSRLRVLESHCRPVHVVLRRLTSEAIDAFCNHPQPHSVKPQHPEGSPQAKTPKKKDPLLAAKPRQPKSSKSDTKKRKPKPPSWSKDDLAESITLDLMNWLPDLVDDGTNVRRSSNATKRKFDGSVSDESLDDSPPYIPNFLTHSNFDPPDCSILEKWRKVCELEREWLEESGVIPAYLSYQPTTTCTSFPPRTGHCLSSLNKPGNFSSGVLHGSSLDKSQRGSLTETPKRKTKPRKKEVTGTALDEGQSRTPTKTKARRQSKKTEVDVSDEASSDISSLPSCQNSAKLVQKFTTVAGNCLEGNTHSGNTLSDSTNNGNTPSKNTTTASPVTSNPQLPNANALNGNSSNASCIIKEPVIKSCLNGNVVTGSTPSGNMLTRNTLAGNASIAKSEARNTVTGNGSTRDTIATNVATTSITCGNTPTENTSAASSIAKNTTKGNFLTKNSARGNLIVIDPVPRKANVRVVSADKLQTVTNSSGFSLPGKTKPEFSRISDTTVDSELNSKLTTDRVQFGQQKSHSLKFSVLPQVTTAKQLPLTLSLDVKRTTSSVSDSNFPPLKRSKNLVISSESQTRSEKLQPSNATSFSSTIATKSPAVASTCGRPSQVPGNPSMIRNIKAVVASTSCHASLSTSNIPATVTGIVRVIAGTSSSPAGITSILSSSCTASSPLTSVSSSLGTAAHTGSRSVLNSSSVAMTEFCASSSSSVPPSQTLSTALAAESGPSKQVNIVVTINSLSNDLKSSSTEGTKSQHDSTDMKPPKLKQMRKPRTRPTSDSRKSLVAYCNSDGAASRLPTLKKPFVACKFQVKASAGEPAQMDGEISESRSDEEMSSWLAASMGLYTCVCGAAFSDSWSCQQHQINCSSGPPE